MFNKYLLEAIRFYKEAWSKKRVNAYAELLCKNVKKQKISKPQRKSLSKILTIATSAGKGGAARAAYDMLCKQFNQRNIYTNNMLVGYHNLKDDPHLHIMPQINSEKEYFLARNEDKWGYLNFFKTCSKNVKNLDIFRNCDLVHLHNLHGFSFNPFILPEITAQKPCIYSLHDMAAFTGHCSYAFACTKWERGCGDCPDLGYYPSLNYDNTARNLKMLKAIYDSCAPMTIVTPSVWLKKLAEQSILQNHEIKLLPYGIDENIFAPANKDMVRQKLNLPQDKLIFTFIADFATNNPQKGGYYLEQACEYYKNHPDIIFLIIGGENAGRIGNCYHIGYIYDTKELAKYYASSDLFIFPTMADNLPFVVLEAMSCGIPVISFDIGGLPDMIDHLSNGYLAKYKDVHDFIAGIELFINDKKLREQASKLARKKVEDNYTIDMCIHNYQKLYEEVFEKRLKITS